MRRRRWSALECEWGLEWAFKNLNGCEPGSQRTLTRSVRLHVQEFDGACRMLPRKKKPYSPRSDALQRLWKCVEAGRQIACWVVVRPDFELLPGRVPWTTLQQFSRALHCSRFLPKFRGPATGEAPHKKLTDKEALDGCTRALLEWRGFVERCDELGWHCGTNRQRKDLSNAVSHLDEAVQALAGALRLVGGKEKVYGDLQTCGECGTLVNIMRGGLVCPKCGAVGSIS